MQTFSMFFYKNADLGASWNRSEELTCWAVVAATVAWSPMHPGSWGLPCPGPCSSTIYSPPLTSVCVAPGSACLRFEVFPARMAHDLSMLRPVGSVMPCGRWARQQEEHSDKQVSEGRKDNLKPSWGQGRRHVWLSWQGHFAGEEAGVQGGTCQTVGLMPSHTHSSP